MRSRGCVLLEMMQQQEIERNGMARDNPDVPLKPVPSKTMSQPTSYPPSTLRYCTYSYRDLSPAVGTESTKMLCRRPLLRL